MGPRLLLALDLLDFDGGKRLPVSVRPAVLFSAFLLEDYDFSISILLKDRSHDARSIEVRLADLNLPALVQQQHPLEPNLGPDLGLKLLDLNPLTGRGLNLFSTAFENRVQELSSHLLTAEILPFYGAATPLSTRPRGKTDRARKGMRPCL